MAVTAARQRDGNGGGGGSLAAAWRPQQLGCSIAARQLGGVNAAVAAWCGGGSGGSILTAAQRRQR
jgi:hypothetical protein